MRFDKYVQELQLYLKDNPESAGLAVVTSKDDKGNGFNIVYVDKPTLGRYDDHEFEWYDTDSEDSIDKEDINAICVN